MTIQYNNIKKYSLAKNKGRKETEKKDFSFKINNNSADYIMPNFARGCEIAKCAYCYVARHHEFGNPLHLDSRLDIYVEKCADFYNTLPAKQPNQQDPFKWVLEIGECSDLLSPGLIEYTNYLMRNIPWVSGFKTTFATKLANKYSVAKLEEGRFDKHRIRVSLMPQKMSNIVEPGTSLIKDRIEAIGLLCRKNIEVHINFSPIILYNTWAQDYIQLLKDIDDFVMSQDAYYQNKLKNMMACEIIFLTHHEKLHQSNLRWNPEAEELMWNPEMQELKVNKRGATDILRYKIETKKTATKLFKAMIAKHLPYCRVRYAF